MSNIPIATKKYASYENFVAGCPWCGKESIFNRASDLCTFELISGRDVSCLNGNCGKRFRIVGDSANNRHEMLIFDCYELIERKHYMNCILSLTQAYEVFFSLYFRVELLYKPFCADRNQAAVDLNRISKELYDKVKCHPFARMRALFLYYMMNPTPPKTLLEAGRVITALPKVPGETDDLVIDSLGDTKLIPLLKALNATSIHTLRNSIVHKQAYRPTRDEVDAALTEARSILFPLTSHLQLYDDINWYVKK